MSFRLRTSRTAYDPTGKSQQQFYYPPRPELKPHYSTSTASNRYASHDLNYTMNSNYYQMGNDRSSQQQQQQQRNDYLSPTSPDANNNPFAPIGYLRQRSTSLLPTIGGHHHSQHHHQQQSNGSASNGMSSNHSNSYDLVSNKNNSSSSSFGVYPLYMPPSSRVGINSSTTTHDYYMMNSKLYPLESKSIININFASAIY
jgi:hypothetical protein